MMLAAVAILSISAQGAAMLVSQTGRRADERELLFRGQAYRDAIASYYRAGRTVETFPKRLEQLLEDTRFGYRRHIRRLYDEPVSGEGWRILRDEQGRIRGVAPKSDRRPLKRANFPSELDRLNGATSYRDWHFVFRPEDTAETASSQGATGSRAR